MSEQPDVSHVPAWDLADRMRKSLRTSGVSVEEMADELDVSRRTVGNWIGGHTEPSTNHVRQWALRTGIPYTWFCHGDLRPCILRPQPVTNGTFPQVRRRVNNMHYSQTKMAS
jgi:transcriptional regulator with XRE-family HTH domain